MTDYVRERDVVTPGQLLSDDQRTAGAHTYVYGGKVYAAVAGIIQYRDSRINILPSKSPYKPSESDFVVGIITDSKPSHYEVDLGWHLVGFLHNLGRRSRIRLQIGDVVYTQVKNSGIRGVFLEGGQKLVKISRGLLIRVSPVKIPRIIGKKGSMLNVLNSESGCRLYVGRNGLIAIVGESPEKELAVASAIKMIEEESHLPGLTERVTHHLRKKIVGGEILGEG
ncbi:MAG: exosome complex protein Rrp4 [Nitrososphaerota archaeon]|nr:exosome complex protein Rrp4 [Candidatus Calditenuaceae archaeon]MDW8072764.1 exosome complex protein Rrp4 [Nitrososphaerota archaeon]